MERDKKVNLLVRGVDSLNGYQTKILNKIWEKIECNKCVIISRNGDGKDKYGKKYVNIPYCGNDCEYYDIGELLTIPEEVLFGMKKYESMIFETVMRGCEISIYTLDECKQKYHKELIYWYSLIKKYNINCMIFHNVPHMTHDYVVYCLGKVLDIPTLLFSPISLKGRLQWGESFEQLGNATNKLYEELLKESNKKCSFSRDIQIYYDTNFKKNEEVITKNNDEWRREISKLVPIGNNVYYSKKKINDRWRKIIISKKGSKKSNNVASVLKKLMEDIKLMCRCKLKISKSIETYGYHGYDELTNKMLEKKYIYYGLHQCPDASVIPRAYTFHEQQFVIAILAKAAEKEGVYVYVKEHFVQYYRNKEFYDFLRSFPNVKLFGPTDDNLKLIYNSIAVSTISGSCIMEAMSKRVPAIVFGDDFSTNRPGAFRVRDIESCREAIKKIKNKEYDISDEKIKLFLQAVQETTIAANLVQKHKIGSIISDEESIKNLSEFIVKYLEKMGYGKEKRV